MHTTIAKQKYFEKRFERGVSSSETMNFIDRERKLIIIKLIKKKDRNQLITTLKNALSSSENGEQWTAEQS